MQPPMDNPYEAPQSEIHAPEGGEAELIRTAHISHEASVKSIGTLMILGGFLTGFGMVSVLAIGRISSEFLVVLAISGGLFGVGFSVRRLNPVGRILAGILCGLGLLAFPIGTIINGYFIYLLFSPKGTMVFSESYKEIIVATPHVRYRTSLAARIVIALLILIFAAALIFFARRGRTF
jgi:hypothetical protein